MFAHRSTGDISASKDADVPQVAPGRSTLTQQLDQEYAQETPARPPSPPLFAQGAEWEDIEPAAPEADVPDPGHEAAMLAHLATPPGPSVAKATAPLPRTAPIDEGAIEPTHELASGEPDAEAAEAAEAAGADEAPAVAHAAAVAPAASGSPAPAAHAAGHAAPHTTPAVAAEHHLEHKRVGKPFYARQDALNRGTVHDNRVKGHVKLARPGVAVGKGSKRHDEFTLADGGTKHRYLIAPNSENTLIPHGTVTNKSIKRAKGRFAVNPAHVRGLVIPGEEAKGAQDCVLTWFGPGGAGWMKVSDIHGGQTIAKAANSAAKAENPHPAAAAAKDTTRFQVRAGGIAAPGTNEKNQYIKPHQKSTKANHKSDYLEHGSKATGGQVNLCMNLPSQHAPPVAIDVLLPGQVFFVPNEPDHKVPSKYVREIAIYGHNANKTKLAEVWVFGYVAKTATEADPSRSGWLPLRVIAPA
jgi:hypothetical protein